MDRREFLEKTGAGILGMSALSAGLPRRAAAQDARRPPNIILFVTDDQHRHHFNFLPEGRDANGRPRNLTPNFDRLAREGVAFDQAYCSSPVCVPSRFSLLTGLYASRATNQRFTMLHRLHGHTFIHQDPMIQPATPTLAARLKELGYVTGFVGKNHTIEAPGWELIDTREDLNDPAVAAKVRRNHELAREAIRRTGFDFADRIYHRNANAGVPGPLACHNMEWLVEGAFDFLDHYADKPFFLYLATTVPHGPANGWRQNPLATPAGMLDKAPDVMPARETIRQRLDAAGIGLNRGDLLWLDDGIGALLGKLEERGALDDTIILFYNDHGVEGGKTTIYQGGMRTVGLAWGAAPIHGGRQSGSFISGVDYAPTILELCGGKAESAGFDGVSFVPLLTGEADSVRETVYGEIGHTRAVIKGNWKYLALRYSEYIRAMDAEERQAWLDEANRYRVSVAQTPFTENRLDGPFGHSGFIPDGWDHEKDAMREQPSYFDADQLYDLSADPHERNNLAGDPAYSKILQDMKAELRKILNRLPGGFAEFKADDQTGALSAEERRDLGRRARERLWSPLEGDTPLP